MNSGGGRKIRHRPEASHRNFFCDFELHTTGASASSEPQEARRFLENLDLTGDLARTRKCVISNTSFYWRFACFRRRLLRRRKLGLPFELAAVTVTPLYALMATTGITPMLAHRMATMGLTGSSTEFSSAPARGITATMDVPASMGGPIIMDGLTTMAGPAIMGVAS